MQAIMPDIGEDTMQLYNIKQRKDGKDYNPTGRQEKRAERRAFGRGLPVQIAYYSGEAQAFRRHPCSNPYPSGKRHDAFEQGLAMADPIGKWHGRNR